MQRLGLGRLMMVKSPPASVTKVTKLQAAPRGVAPAS